MEKCLNSIYQREHKTSFKVYYVDNGSTDGTAGYVKEYFPQVELILNERNLGFAPANNQAIARGKGKYVLLLNSDAELLDDAIDNGVAYLDTHPEVGIVGARVLNPDGTLQKGCMCRTFPTLMTEFIALCGLDRLLPRSKFFGRYKMSYFDFKTAIEVDQAGGPYILARREIFDKVGLLDEGYGAYYEDVDWCYKASKKGWKGIYLPDVRIIHYGGQTYSSFGPQIVAKRIRSKMRFFKKNYGALSFFILRVFIFFELLIKILVSAIGSKVSGTKEPMKSYRAGFIYAFKEIFITGRLLTR